MYDPADKYYPLFKMSETFNDAIENSQIKNQPVSINLWDTEFVKCKPQFSGDRPLLIYNISKDGFWVAGLSYDFLSKSKQNIVLVLRRNGDVSLFSPSIKFGEEYLKNKDGLAYYLMSSDEETVLIK